MIKTVRDACKIHPMVSDYRMTEAIENLSDLIIDQGAGTAFFERNYVTQGMSELFREGLLRLSGKSDQAAFELSQAMGGGKTHLMVAFGLLAGHPELREKILPVELNRRIDFDRARLAAFNGRNDPDHFIWGEIGSQLGMADLMRPYWVDGPRSIDEAGWIQIIGEEATLILLDELPPYLAMAGARAAGRGTLADLVTYSIGGLLSAAIKLPRCCVVIANLSGSYAEQTRDLAKLVSNLHQETRRQAQTITPVQLAGNEIYQILKKRLLIETSCDEVVDAVAEAFAEQVRAAEDGGYITARSMEQVAEEVRETYPFHPSFKNLVALFKENEGFRQTRGLMQFTARLLKSVWNRETNDVFLIGTQHLDLNDVSVRDEIQRINPALLNAVVTDIADNGNARAEEIDEDLNNYWSMAEIMLWSLRERRAPWRDILMRAKTDPAWPWMPGVRGLESLRDKALQQGRWREGADGYIEKGPFPAEKTSVNVTVQGVDRSTGEATLTLTPRNAGASPRIYVTRNGAVSENDKLVEDPDNFRSTDATLYFIAVDSEGRHEIGDAKRWVADLSIRHEIKAAADRRKVELQVTPRGEIRYTLDGTNPKEGIGYHQPFEVPNQGCTILVYASADEAEKSTSFKIPADGDKRVRIDEKKPAALRETVKVSLDDTEKTFRFVQKFKDRPDTRLRGVQIIIGEGEHSVLVRFNERTITATTIEATIHAIRSAISDDQAGVQIVVRGGIEFGDGFALREFAELAGLDLKPGDVVQDGN